jgi:hypothetical protein
MCASEVSSARTAIRDFTVDAAASGIYTTYVGIGADLDRTLTELVTVANGSNYFSVNSVEEFDAQIASQIPNAFFPTVRELEIGIVSQQHSVSGVFGAGKEQYFSRAGAGWTEETAVLHPRSVKDSVSKLMQTVFSSDLIATIVDMAAGEPRPVVVCTESSVYPSPASTRPGMQQGGFVLVGLDSLGPQHAGDGTVRIVLQVTHLDGRVELLTKDVSVGEEREREGGGGAATDGASSEAMAKAMVLKQYVDCLREVLQQPDVRQVPSSFEVWFSDKARQFDLQKELQNVQQIKSSLQRIQKSAPKSAS